MAGFKFFSLLSLQIRTTYARRAYRSRDSAVPRRVKRVGARGLAPWGTERRSVESGKPTEMPANSAPRARAGRARTHAGRVPIGAAPPVMPPRTVLGRPPPVPACSASPPPPAADLLPRPPNVAAADRAEWDDTAAPPSHSRTAPVNRTRSSRVRAPQSFGRWVCVCVFFLSFRFVFYEFPPPHSSSPSPADRKPGEREIRLALGYSYTHPVRRARYASAGTEPVTER